MGGLGLMILFVGCLSTGDTRNKVYRTWRGRVGGRISCAIVSCLVESFFIYQSIYFLFVLFNSRMVGLVSLEEGDLWEG